MVHYRSSVRHRNSRKYSAKKLITGGCGKGTQVTTSTNNCSKIPVPRLARSYMILYTFLLFQVSIPIANSHKARNEVVKHLHFDKLRIHTKQCTSRICCVFWSDVGLATGVDDDTPRFDIVENDIYSCQIVPVVYVCVLKACACVFDGPPA